MSSELYALLGVVIGGVIAILGNLITVLIQRDQEKIKFKKDIFDLQFKIPEEYLAEYFRELPKMLSKGGIEGKKYAHQQLVKNSIDMEKLQILEITEDEPIINSIAKLREEESNVLCAYNKQYLNDDAFMVEAIVSISGLLDAYFSLRVNIEKFKLGGYKPRKKPFWK